MDRSTTKRLTVALTILVAITVAYFWIDHTAAHDGVPSASTGVTVAAIALALVKYRIVLRTFMDVDRAPRGLRRVTDLLVAVIAVSLFATYFIAKAVA